MKQERKFQEPGKRHLKVYQKHLSRSYHRYVIFPEIRLCGRWLHNIGFGCGQSVTVQHERNKIIITVDSEGNAHD